MELVPDYVFLLLAAGALAGFIAGLVGVGGGIIFAPVLLFYFSHVGVASASLAPLTIGSSLFCTCLVSVSATHAQHDREAVNWRAAILAGLGAAVAIFLMTRFVTTQPFYNARVFQVIFSVLLFVVAAQMAGLFGRGKREAMLDSLPSGSRLPGEEVQTVPEAPGLWLAMSGSIAGIVSAAVGVGGGIVMVPMLERGLHFPIHRAVGTSSAAIVLISGWGVVSYVFTGWGLDLTPSSAGFVDFGTAGFLVVPALLTAPLGVRLSHALNRKRLRRIFAVLAVVVAVRLMVRVVWGT